MPVPTCSGTPPVLANGGKGAYAATNITAAWAASRAAVLFCTLLSQRLQSTKSKIKGVFRE